MARAAKNQVRGLKVRVSKLLERGSDSGSLDPVWFQERIGEDANTDTLSALQAVLKKGLPVLCIYSDSPDAQLFDLALPGLVREEGVSTSNLEHIVIPGKDHVFTMPGQSEELSRALIAWLRGETWNAISETVGQWPEATNGELNGQ
jgi:hypothetical protein